VYRLAFDLEEGTWWVESQKALQLLAPEPVYDPKKKKKKDEPPPPSNFTYAEKYGKKPTRFPGGVQLKGVLKEQTGYVPTGIVYVHFFPNGFSEPAILYLTKEGAEAIAYSVIIRPTAGKVEVESGEVRTFEQGEAR
jgi:hypothetical protein